MIDMAGFDHFAVACQDLEEGVRYVESLTGVRAAPGGPHPGIPGQHAHRQHVRGRRHWLDDGRDRGGVQERHQHLVGVRRDHSA